MADTMAASAPDLTSNSSGSPTTVLGMKVPEGVSMPGWDKATEAVNKVREAAAGAKENKETALRMTDRCQFLLQVLRETLQGESGNKLEGVIKARAESFVGLLGEILSFLEESKVKPKWSRMFYQAKIRDAMIEYEAQVDRFCRDMTLALALAKN
ncbi:hypothetical protein HDU93_004117 [Gonapodya sp. JEL0774]|nr:hypothetical protein HDU93_004117 [Gonapodya sp. JEL0774]